MNNKSKFIKFILIIFLLSGCQGLMPSKKSQSGNEFLVKKKDPLIIPPEFEKLPTPDSEIKIEKNEPEVLKTLKSSNQGTNNQEKSDLEKKILDQIQ